MSSVKCPACGNIMEIPAPKSGLPWLIGCLVALFAIPMVIAVIGLLAAIAIPSFVKARSTSQMNACINNMRMIDSAKEQWALATQADIGQVLEITAVNEYLQVSPTCPAGGTYTYHQVGQDPECSVHGTLSNPQESRRNHPLQPSNQ